METNPFPVPASAHFPELGRQVLPCRAPSFPCSADSLLRADWAQLQRSGVPQHTGLHVPGVGDNKQHREVRESVCQMTSAEAAQAAALRGGPWRWR